MSVRAYNLYFSGAAAAAVANVPVVRNGDVLGVNFAGYAAVGNGSWAEISTNPTRLGCTNDAAGPMAFAALSNAATGPEQLHESHFVPIPAGLTVKVGDKFYLHTTQKGSAGSVDWQVTIYVRES